MGRFGEGIGAGYVWLSATELVSAGNLKSARRVGTELRLEFNDGTERVLRHGTAAEAGSALATLGTTLAAANTVTVTEATGSAGTEFNMQPMYGESDTPTADPGNVAQPAFYRGRAHNTFWLWDTEELKWFPVVTS